MACLAERLIQSKCEILASYPQCNLYRRTSTTPRITHMKQTVHKASRRQMVRSSSSIALRIVSVVSTAGSGRGSHGEGLTRRLSPAVLLNYLEPSTNMGEMTTEKKAYQPENNTGQGASPVRKAMISESNAWHPFTWSQPGTHAHHFLAPQPPQAKP